MLTHLREVLAAEGGRPIRVEVLARRLGTDPATLAAMLEHLRRRGLGSTSCAAPAAACHAAVPTTSAPAACRRCPLVAAPPGGRPP